MKILVSYLTGIGNTILFLPTLRAIQQQLREAVVDVMVRHQASKEILERVGCCRRILVFHPALHRNVMQRIAFLRMLRQERYDVNLTAFPSNRAEFNILSALSGAKRRIASRYQAGYFQTLAFLQTETIPAEASQHEVEQNLSLLVSLGIDLREVERDIRIDISSDEMADVDAFLDEHSLTPDDILIGFHPGCNPAQGNIYRRWPPEYFAMLGDRLAEQFGATILVGFGGPEEHQLYAAIAALMQHPPVQIKEFPLLKGAALIKRCRLFVAADSGMMHLATAMQTPTVALSGPIDPQRNAPYGEEHTQIKARIPCAPCNTYPHHQHGGSFIKCIYQGDLSGQCMKSITPDDVFELLVERYGELLTRLREEP